MEDTQATVRIFRGHVWRSSSHTYYLQDNEQSYRINSRYVDSDGVYTPPLEAVFYRDFNDFWNEDEPRPRDGLTK